MLFSNGPKALSIVAVVAAENNDGKRKSMIDADVGALADCHATGAVMRYGGTAVQPAGGIKALAAGDGEIVGEGSWEGDVSRAAARARNCMKLSWSLCFERRERAIHFVAS